MEEKKHFYVTITLGFLVFIIMLVVVYLTVVKKNSVVQTLPVANTQAQEEVTKYKGYFQLSPVKAEYKLGELIIVQVLANSDNQSVSGFDLVVTYNPTKLKYMSNEVLDKDFQAITKNNKGILKITAYKTTSDVGGKVFADKALVSLNFAPITTGEASISLMFAKNQTNETNLLNDQNEDVLTIIKSANITIK